MSTKELKIELKSLANDIRKHKFDLKEYQREHCGNGGGWFYKLHKLQYNFRHMHIAYCLLRGRKYEEIERNCNRVGDPNWTFIKEITNEHKAIENVCAHA
jgi:hypothetical protein